MRAGLARLTKSDYAPWPTVYDGLFPNGTFLTAPKAKRDGDPQPDAAANPEPPDRAEAEEHR